MVVWTRFKKARIPEEGEVRCAVLEIATHILEHGRIGRGDFRQITNTGSNRREMLTTKVSTIVPNTESIAFGRTHAGITARGMIEEIEMDIATKGYKFIPGTLEVVVGSSG